VSSGGAVVVGIDGSRAALCAARWAVAEAIERDAVLRLVFVLNVGAPTRARDVHRGEYALGRASAASRVDDHGPRVETALVDGHADSVLIEESNGAAMVCVGRGGEGWRAPLGPTATALARYATCPVAIIRENLGAADTGDAVIAVVLDDDPGNDELVRQAMREGRLRHATVRQIDRRCASWVRRYPDVHVETVATGCGGTSRPSRAQVLPQLAVVGKADGEKIADLVSPCCHPIVGYPDCSVLLVRG
jgi:nucleotide-binding universal stress UspA family protein